MLKVSYTHAEKRWIALFEVQCLVDLFELGFRNGIISEVLIVQRRNFVSRGLYLDLGLVYRPRWIGFDHGERFGLFRRVVFSLWVAHSKRGFKYIILLLEK